MDKYKVLISGKNPDYFLKKVISNKINIYDISKRKGKNNQLNFKQNI